MESALADLHNRDDVYTLVSELYRRVFTDDLLGPNFVDIARMDLDHHLPIICDFGEPCSLAPDSTGEMPCSSMST